jgi:hypothetical protein
MQGFIALHRKLLDSWVAEDPLALALWVRILVEATYKPRNSVYKGKMYQLKAGDLFFGLDRWAEKTGIGREVIRSRIKLFENDGMITRSKHPKISIISITNWQDYQVGNTLTTPTEHPQNMHRTRTEHQYNKGNNINKVNNRDNKDMSASQAKANENDSRVTEIFRHWQKVMGKDSRAKLTQKRKSKISARLKDGFTVQEICRAISGCANSAYHMGQNDSGTIYDDLELICRDDGKLRQFLSISEKPKQQYSQATATTIQTLNEMEFD